MKAYISIETLCGRECSRHRTLNAARKAALNCANKSLIKHVIYEIGKTSTSAWRVKLEEVKSQ